MFNSIQQLSSKEYKACPQAVPGSGVSRETDFGFKLAKETKTTMVPMVIQTGFYVWWFQRPWF